MALHYLIDGYNLLRAPRIPPGTWQKKREALLKLLSSRRPYGRNQATVIFDSRQGGGERQARGRVEVLFAPGSADDWIIEQVREVRNRRVVVVVSDDQGLRRMIRGTGTRWLSCAAFMGSARPAGARSPTQAENLGPRDYRGIEEEVAVGVACRRPFPLVIPRGLSRH